LNPYWVVLDNLKSTGVQYIEPLLSWYFHSPTHLRKTEYGFQSEEPTGILIMSAQQQLATRSGKGYAAYSPEYQFGKNREIDWIAFDQKSHIGEQRFGVLLYPYKDQTSNKEEPRVRFREVTANHYVVETGTFADHLYFLNQPYDGGGVATDAVFLWVRYKDSKPERYSVTQGSYLRLRGSVIFSRENKTDSEGRVN